MATNRNHFTPSNKKEIFEILSGVNYRFRQIGSIHTEGMGLYFDDKSKEPKWHISIHSSNDSYQLVYSEFSDKENEWVRKDEQTCGSFNDVLSTLKLYKKELDNLGLEKAPQQKPTYFKYAIYDNNGSCANWYLTKTNEFDYFYCPQGSDYHEMRKLFLNSLALFDTAEDAKKYVYQNKKDIIRKNTVDIIQIKIEDESHYHFGRKSIIHIKNYNEDIDEYDMEIDGIDLYYNNNIIGQLGITKDRKYNGEVALVSNLSKRFIQSVMHYLYSTLSVEWKKPTILSSPIEDKYFGYNPGDIYTDDIDVVYGSKTIGYCGTKDRHFTGEIRFKDGVDENLKKAVLYKFNNSSLYNDVEWREVGKIEESIENKLKEKNMNKIKESKNIFPCTIYMVNQDWDEEIYYYLDTPDYGLDWRYCDDVEQEDIENYKYVIKNIADLRTSIKNLKETFIGGYGDKYFQLSKNYMEELLNRGETLVRSFNSNVDDEDRIFMIKIEPVQNLELSLAESFEKTLKNLQKEGLFENIKSFDLDFNGKSINIKLNEMAYKDDYREYNKKGKEYIKYRDRTLRQQDVLICKLYQLKPVSFTFNDTIFTIKYDKAWSGQYGFIWISFNAFKEQEQVGHGSIELYDFQWHIMDQLNKKVSTSLDFTRYEKKLNSGEIKYRHIIADDVYDNADISRKDKETFINIFEKYLFEFLKPALYFDSTEDHNNLYQTIRQNRRKKLDQVNSEVVNAQKKAEGSWRKEHFGVEGYEVGQTVEVFDGRTGGARSLGKIIKMTPSGTATIQLEDGTTIVRRNVENDEYIKLFQPFGRKYSVFDGDYRKKNLALPSASTEDTITNRKKVLDLE